jgi:hypothetical protein
MCSVVSKTEKQNQASKRWKDKNKEAIKSYNQNYYKNNKSNKARYDEYNKKRKVKVECCCGKFIQIQNLKKHMITSIHGKRMILKECRPVSRL